LGGDLGSGEGLRQSGEKIGDFFWLELVCFGASFESVLRR